MSQTDYEATLQDWAKDNPSFDVGMSVLCYTSGYKGHIEFMGRIVERVWRRGYEYGWIYKILRPDGREVWENPVCMERLAMCRKEIAAYLREVV